VSANTLRTITGHPGTVAEPPMVLPMSPFVSVADGMFRRPQW